ncbi:MAG: sn-glycerol-3-phosphate ABC transporter ATP-binding protein UgpC [Pseudomonadota bacterium]
MASVELDKLRKSYGSTAVIHGIDLGIEDGEFCVFVGPSGCGKSTLLRMIAGLEDISDGELRLGGKRVNEVAAAQRGLAMVFQSYALYPHMSVRQNLAFGLENMHTPKEEIENRVSEAARMLQIDQFLARKPRQLSGGQRQRVAIGRAVVREPSVFLFDEPLSNLDAELRVQMRVEIASLHQRLGNTMIYVTHDQVEAMTMADRIVVLRLGIVEQVGPPLELYNTPANRFVAGFIGSPRMNFLEGSIAGLEADTAHVKVEGLRDIPVRVDASQCTVGEEVALGVRPEHIHRVDENEGSAQASVTTTEQLGSDSYLYCDLVQGQRMIIHHPGQTDIRPRDHIHLAFDPEHSHLFRRDDSGAVIPRRAN